MGKGSRAKKPRVKFKPRELSKDVATGQPPPPRGAAERPTDERKARGVWIEPQGAMRAAQPTVDVANDAVGRMYERKLIGKAEEQAARRFQEIRAAYIAEMPDIAQFKSCIAGSVPGYDDGDGNPAILAAYRKIERTMTPAQRSLVIALCEGGHVPTDVLTYRRLRDGLCAMAGVDMPRKNVVIAM